MEDVVSAKLLLQMNCWKILEFCVQFIIHQLQFLGISTQTHKLFFQAIKKTQSIS